MVFSGCSDFIIRKKAKNAPCFLGRSNNRIWIGEKLIFPPQNRRKTQFGL